MVGDFRVDESLSFSIWNEEQLVKFRVLGKNDQHAVSFISEDTLFVPTLQLGIFSLADPAGNVDTVKIKIKDQSSMLMATRVSNNVAEFLPLASYNAAYHNNELDITYTIKNKGNHLVVTSSRIGDIRLKRLNQDRFIGDQWFFKDVIFQRNTDGSVTGLTVSSNRARNVQFKKL